MATLAEKIAAEVEELERALASGRLSAKADLFAHLRRTSLPFIPCHRELSPADVYRLSCRFLRVLGRHHLPVAVGTCMNQYMMSTIATVPLGGFGEEMTRKRAAFLDFVQGRQLILAVSSSDDHIWKAGVTGQQVNGASRPDGTIVLRGMKNYQSNVGEADLLLFTAVVDGSRMGMFFAPLKGNRHLRLGEPHFDNAMRESDTRRVYFDDLVLGPDQTFAIGGPEASGVLHLFSRIWFGGMAVAPYVGGAGRALEEAARFLRSVEVAPGRPLSSLGNYVVDMGRMGVELRACEDLMESFAARLERMPSAPEALGPWMWEAESSSVALKYTVTDACARMVAKAVRIVGTRALQEGQILNRLSQEIVFGPLHPPINVLIEQRFGDLLLKE